MSPPAAYSAANSCGLIEAQSVTTFETGAMWYSAANSCGLIEACVITLTRSMRTGIPQRTAAASLKRAGICVTVNASREVFRSEQLRPH